ncbi:L,D-transpeptidase family protein [Croceicoccus sp. BE223]|uniref:L,D-transpeptidase family protein n=1 Tax=Croceicoccus sp. BE223 TaxID=2817716 RepID=UPI00285DB8DB|nr:L,D-transpeptidase family protein [Croceicoccus sp. BE223]MDR7103407.1 lipoprotein-anchoring transpeptidase ErfK/SrfK [Croceicoccus sp. BE223]
MIRKSALLLGLPVMLALSACSDEPAADSAPEASATAAPEADNNMADAMRSNDRGDADAIDMPDSEARPMMQAQVVLDRLGFSPGVIDGKSGISTKNALNAFQEANSLPVTGEIDDATEQALGRWNDIAATRVVTVPEDFAIGRFEKIPEDPADQAKMTQMGYESLDEKLAERFHTTVETLKMLNPNGMPATSAPAAGATPASTSTPTPTATSTAGPPASGASTVAEAGPPSVFKAGQQIRVPNIGADFIDAKAETDDDWRDTLRMLGVGTDQPEAARIVVDKSDSTLKAYDAQDKLIAAFTITSGSKHDPLPLGEWKILGIAHNPPFAYDPSLFWDVPDHEEKQQLPPGPNGPVGVAWIDLSKEHYGIHGTPHPETIGRAESHGCVRLTNWDVARLAEMVSQKTKVLFQA